MSVIVQEPEGPTAVITSSEPIVSSTITITANSDCPYSITFYGHESSTILECGDITTYTWQIIDPEGNEVETGIQLFDIPVGIKMVYNDFDICGVYAVKLTVTDACENTDSEALSVIVECPEGPTAVITGSPGNIEACSGCPYPAVFDGTSSTTNAACGGLTYAWTIDVPPGVTPIAFDPATGQTASYGFEDCGTYTVTLVVTDGCNNTDSTSVTFEVTEPFDPVADIANTESSASPIGITACSECPYTIGFDGTGSTNNTLCGDLTYYWTIITPTTTSNLSTSIISYNFVECGTHTVTLLVTDACENTDSEMVVVVVSEPAPPTVVITGSPGDITACSACPYPATFGSTVTSGATCGDITYAWSMTSPEGADDFDPNNEPTADYSFEVCGVYVINLDITDGCGKTAHASVTLEVSEPGAPTAAWECYPSWIESEEGYPDLIIIDDTGEVITFDATDSTWDSICGIVNYHWVWGDGTEDDDTNNPITTHTFVICGGFEVILTVTDACGKTDAEAKLLVVCGP